MVGELEPFFAPEYISCQLFSQLSSISPSRSAVVAHIIHTSSSSTVYTHEVEAHFIPDTTDLYPNGLLFSRLSPSPKGDQKMR